MTATATGPLGESLAAWVLAPVLLVAVSTGIGLLAQAIARVRLPRALWTPIGFCGLIVLLMTAYRLGARVELAIGLALAVAAAGYWVARRELRARWAPGWLFAAGVATYVLHLLPVLFAGGWTWTGYNFVNDTAVQFVLAQALADHGASTPPGGAGIPAPTTFFESLRLYRSTDYPVGSHSVLATLAALVPAPLPAIYQPFIASCAALAAVALGMLARRAGLAPLLAALVGFGALAANLPFVYGLQGNVKEIAMLTCLAAAAATAREALGAHRPAATVALVAVCLAAAVSVYSAAAVPYVGTFAATLLGAALVQRDATLRRRLVPAAAVGLVAGCIASLATLVTIVHFGEVAKGTFGTAAVAADLGHLIRPLQFAQTAGIWLAEDYRLPVPAGREWINHVLVALVAIALVAGTALSVARRETAPLLMLVPALVTLAVLGSRTSPYATGKMLALASPGIVLTAGIALGWLAGRARVPSALAALAIAGGMLYSDALAYHDVQLAPIDKMRALEELDARLAGLPQSPDWLLVDEHEEFAKYFLRRTRQNVALELVTPAPVRDGLAAGFIPLHADVDQMPLHFLARHPLIVQRRGADSSRPPADYVRDGGNAFFDVWRRKPGVEVRAHLLLQSLFAAYGQPDCAAVEQLAAQAQDGDELVAATAPDEVRFDFEERPAPAGWPPHPTLPGVRVPQTPGIARAQLDFPAGGRWRIWVFGSIGRPLQVRVDGGTAGEAVGVNTAGEWLSAGEAHVRAGRHTVELVRSGGNFKPGDGYVGAVGPVVFQRVEPQRLVWTAPGQARSLCDRRLDWVELARRS